LSTTLEKQQGAMLANGDTLDADGQNRLPCHVNKSFDEPEGSFSAVYLPNPSANFASVNAGDYGLYVGGGAINRAFKNAMVDCGHTPQLESVFETVHQNLIALAAKCSGRLQWIPNNELPANFLCICGLVPDPQFIDPKLYPVGLVSISVFAEEQRPLENSKNIAMIYVVGPNCGQIRRKGRRQVDEMSAANFLSVIHGVAHGVASAISQYNIAASEQRLPSIEILRVCLLSGGIYKHPDASKLEVAAALIKGLLSNSGLELPHLDFAWDEDVFRRAWHNLGLDNPEPPNDSSNSQTASCPQPATAAACTERRIDPMDNKAYSYLDMERYYSGKYSKSDIQKYWEMECPPESTK